MWLRPPEFRSRGACPAGTEHHGRREATEAPRLPRRGGPTVGGAGGPAAFLRVPAPSPRRAVAAEVERARSESAGPRRGRSRGPPGGRSPAPTPAWSSCWAFVPVGGWGLEYTQASLSLRFWVCADQTVTGDLYQLSTFYDSGNVTCSAEC